MLFQRYYKEFSEKKECDKRLDNIIIDLFKTSNFLNLHPESCKMKYFCTFAQHYLAGHLLISYIFFLSII